jgi:hypothetical protein
MRRSIRVAEELFQRGGPAKWGRKGEERVKKTGLHDRAGQGRKGRGGGGLELEKSNLEEAGLQDRGGKGVVGGAGERWSWSTDISNKRACKVKGGRDGRRWKIRAEGERF